MLTRGLTNTRRPGTCGAGWDHDADAAGADAVDGRSAEETRGVSEETRGVDAGAAGGTVAALGRDESSPGGRKDHSGGGPQSSQNSEANAAEVHGHV